MKLNRFERQVLANQYAMLELLSEAGDKKHWAEAREAVESGYEAFYFQDAVYEDHHVLDRAATSEVLDILTMFDSLKRGFARATPSDAARLGVDARDVEFLGFDGNKETSLMGFVDFYCSRGRGGAFAGLTRGGQATSINSHAEVLPAYRRMLAAWKALGDSKGDPSIDQIAMVTAEWSHPSNRK